MRLEVRSPELEVIELDDSFAPITHKGRVRVVSNGVQAISILGPGKKRDRLVTDYLARQKPKPKIEVIVPEAQAAPPIIEQTEAEQVIEAVEPWIPDPNDFFDCTLSSRLGAAVIIGELSNQELVWVHERDITVRPNGHSLCLPKGTKMFVRLALNTKNPRFQFRALECQIEDEQKESHATGAITYWTGSLGSARMGCGCSIGIGTASRDDQLDLNVGDRVEFDIVFSEKLQKVLGKNITVLGTKE